MIEDLQSSQGKQEAAVRLLAQRKGDAAQVVPALTEALKSKSSNIRRSAAIGLGAFGDKARDAIPALQTALDDADARVREAARTALSRIDPSLAPKAAQ